MTADDCRLLCQEMGICDHAQSELVYGRGMSPKQSVYCRKCKKYLWESGYIGPRDIPNILDNTDGFTKTFTTVPEREDVMQWAFGQEWWEDFDDIATEVWWPEGQSPRGDYLAWLFQSTEHFAELLAGFLREKGGEDG